MSNKINETERYVVVKDNGEVVANFRNKATALIYLPKLKKLYKMPLKIVNRDYYNEV